MKTFFRKIAIYCIIVSSIIIIINQIYLSKLWSLNDGSGVEKFKYVPEQIDICNFGNSHGLHGYYYADLESDYSCFNFALDSQFLSYDERIMDYYQDRIHEGTVVIIDISYSSCCGIREEEYDWFESQNKRYYRFLPSKYIKQYDFYTDVMASDLRSLSDGPISVASVLLRNVNTDNISRKSYPEVYRELNEESLYDDTMAAANRHILDGKVDNCGNIIFNDEEFCALQAIIDITRSRGAIPILVTVPYTDAYKEAISNTNSKYFKQFYEWINNTSKELGVAYYDYSSDCRFCTDYSLFYNGDHMNSVGARKFTGIIYDEVISDMLR